MASKSRKRLNGSKTRHRLIKVGKRDNWICQICQGPVKEVFLNDPHQKDIHRASVDHITPVVDGGPDTMENYRLAHASCNNFLNGDAVEPFQWFNYEVLGTKTCENKPLRVLV